MVSIDPYTAPAGTSNAVICVYKSTSLGTMASPWKPTAYFAASKTNVTLWLLPGIYYFRVTAQVTALGESLPSNVVTNRVSE